MYRLVDNKGLKAYYYKLINGVLYMYRKEEELCSPKRAIYVGYGQILQRITPKILTMDDGPIFGYDTMSGYK